MSVATDTAPRVAEVHSELELELELELEPGPGRGIEVFSTPRE
jgi:hypothetical protein